MSGKTISRDGATWWREHPGKESHPADLGPLGDSRWRGNQTHVHRLHGPAALAPDGHAGWFRLGDLHRCGGPAVIGRGGAEWFDLGRSIPAPRWWELALRTMEANASRRRPRKFIKKDGGTSWFPNGVPGIGPNDRPANADRHGVTRWDYAIGVIAREDGPAILEPGGRQRWNQLPRPGRT
jgi:hypothetical protein